MPEYNVLTETTNLTQAFLGRASELCFAPSIEETPDSLDTFELPVVLTSLRSSEFNGANNLYDATFNVTSRFLVDSLGSPSLALRQALATEIFDSVLRWVVDESNYILVETPLGLLPIGGYVLSKGNPLRVEIMRQDPTFRTNGLRVFEYPEGTTRKWYGFEMSYTIRANWPFNC